MRSVPADAGDGEALVLPDGAIVELDVEGHLEVAGAQPLVAHRAALRAGLRGAAGAGPLDEEHARLVRAGGWQVAEEGGADRGGGVGIDGHGGEGAGAHQAVAEVGGVGADLNGGAAADGSGPRDRPRLSLALREGGDDRLARVAAAVAAGLWLIPAAIADNLVVDAAVAVAAS